MGARCWWRARPSAGGESAASKAGVAPLARHGGAGAAPGAGTPTARALVRTPGHSDGAPNSTMRLLVLCFICALAGALPARAADVYVRFGPCVDPFDCPPTLTLSEGGTFPLTRVKETYPEWKCDNPYLASGGLNISVVCSSRYGYWVKAVVVSTLNPTPSPLDEDNYAIKEIEAEGEVVAFHKGLEVGINDCYELLNTMSCVNWTDRARELREARRRRTLTIALAAGGGGLVLVALVVSLVAWCRNGRSLEPKPAPFADIELASKGAPAGAVVVVQAGPCAEGHAFRSHCTACGWLLCCSGCCVLALLARRRSCERCGLRG